MPHPKNTISTPGNGKVRYLTLTTPARPVGDLTDDEHHAIGEHLEQYDEAREDPPMYLSKMYTERRRYMPLEEFTLDMDVEQPLPKGVELVVEGDPHPQNVKAQTSTSDASMRTAKLARVVEGVPTAQPVEAVRELVDS